MLGLILWLAAVPLGDDPAFQEGVRLYEQVDLEGAIARFQQASATTDPDRAAAQVWIALCHAQLGRREDATVSFRAAVRLDRQVKLPALAPPDVEAMLEAARAELPALAPEPASSSAVPAVEPAPEEGGSIVPLVVGGGGVVAMLAGATTVAIGMDTALRQATEQKFNDDGRAVRDTGYLMYSIGGAILGVGAAAVGVAAFLAMTE